MYNENRLCHYLTGYRETLAKQDVCHEMRNEWGREKDYIRGNVLDGLFSYKYIFLQKPKKALGDGEERSSILA